jgi:membrane-associated phospholipid phosphatase
MHHPTDALGSMVLAVCWVAALVYLARPNRDVDRTATTTTAAASITQPTVGVPA